MTSEVHTLTNEKFASSSIHIIFNQNRLINEYARKKIAKIPLSWNFLVIYRRTNVLKKIKINIHRVS